MVYHAAGDAGLTYTLGGPAQTKFVINVDGTLHRHRTVWIGCWHEQLQIHRHRRSLMDLLRHRTLSAASVVVVR